ncbi:hypothetical protein GYMLUDRAFT_250896 [Collybiopsis luxurians FD-317 M1]|uniref:Uncharacterized protein n=1 Tax=Collybiopsis luxurians FD-317 M1 TaxID=944289 RepID=A0A0D0BE91_9AGAR|nr:hypothetical protein GYMLUDRAFT_250896 [Collybiopsis luxurians FD-317 M1]
MSELPFADSTVLQSDNDMISVSGSDDSSDDSSDESNQDTCVSSSDDSSDKSSEDWNASYNFPGFKEEYALYCQYLSKDIKMPQKMNCALHLAINRRSDTTGFDMIHVTDIWFIASPKSIEGTFVVVTRGLQVGYYNSWLTAEKYVRVIGSTYSFHSSLRNVWLCYLRALIGQEVIRLSADGLTESTAELIIPPECTFAQYWDCLWTEWDGHDDDEKLQTSSLDTLVFDDLESDANEETVYLSLDVQDKLLTESDMVSLPSKIQTTIAEYSPCTVHEMVLRPIDQILEMNIAHLTGFTMFKVFDVEASYLIQYIGALTLYVNGFQDIDEPQNSANLSVAVLQGLDVGYFILW